MPNELPYLLNIVLAVLLSLVIGVEREYNQKQAGVRTHTLVGLGSALFMVVSKYGFYDVLGQPGIGLDPSRIAAQIVSGVGFLGAGLIFVRRDVVRGLTTAASIWLVAAVGMAAGAGMYLIAPGVVLVYLLVALGIKPLTQRMPHAKGTRHSIRLRYRDGHGLLRDIIAAVAAHGMKVSNLQILKSEEIEVGAVARVEDAGRFQEIVLGVDGSPNAVDNLLIALSSIDGVRQIGLDREDSES